MVAQNDENIPKQDCYQPLYKVRAYGFRSVRSSRMLQGRALGTLMLQPSYQ